MDTPVAPANASTSVSVSSNHTWRIKDMQSPVVGAAGPGAPSCSSRGSARRRARSPPRGASVEPVLSSTLEHLAPARAADERVSLRPDATNTLPQAFGVEAEDRREIGAGAGG